MTSAPSWILSTSETVKRWVISLANQNSFGLFRNCLDSEIPYDFPASHMALILLKKMSEPALKEKLEWIKAVEGYSSDALNTLISRIQSCQQPDTGLFIDPYLDKRFLLNKSDERAYTDFRRAVTKYSILLLENLEAKPLYPYSESGGTENPDPQEYLEYIKTGDWDQPWAVCSHAGERTRDLFNLINQGHEEYIPALCEGLEFILSKQNRQTGMWGASSIPLFQQISGVMKLITRFQWWMGFEMPYLNRLADSCIACHADKTFYAGIDNICIPRNIAEVCVVCLVNSDYRRQELLATLISIADYIESFKMPDGAFGISTQGTEAITWCGSGICGTSQTPRSDLCGTFVAAGALGIIGGYLNWAHLPWEFPFEGWKQRVNDLKYRIVHTHGGKVEIVKA